MPTPTLHRFRDMICSKSRPIRDCKEFNDCSDFDYSGLMIIVKHLIKVLGSDSHINCGCESPELPLETDLSKYASGNKAQEAVNMVLV